MFFITATSLKEKYNLIQTLSFNKSTGPNNSIPTSILKKIKKKIPNPFSRIINNSFENGIFPILWKSAKVILIFKIGSRLFCRNYISIFLLSNLGKIMEKISLKKLNHFLEKHTIFYALQFSFRLNTSMSLY